MKLVQFIRPLFLVALGLHALVLFLPTGEESEVAVVEDLSFSDDSDLLDSTSDNLLRRPLGTPASDQLPIANPSSVAIASRKAAKPTAARMPAQTQTAVRRTSPLASQTASPQTNRPADGDNNSSTDRSSESPTNDSQTEDPSTSVTDQQTPATNQTRRRRPPTNNIPNLSSTATNSPSDNGQTASRQTTTGADGETVLSAANLAAKLTNPISDEQLESLLDQISDLAASLTYSEENTDDASASQNRIDWQADIQRQANVGKIESIAPRAIADLTEIDYPIESPKQAGMKARSLSLCLEETPHNAEVGVRFDSQGNVAGNPLLVRSTGYDALNDEIIATVISYDDFPPNRNSKAYLLEFEIDYDAEACVSLEELRE
ncbi:hypothetical protein [cf. Phormidesmis sp. LEGE 11477]|uniref:hypothetical protein n=1 Tax=cf. Phormidesmis sp. LEGE 11477 TaxID=1828680 RepID=UPI00187E1E07|nr:hypothetical protein [cf. Phormidesmis sp. LEGE 11477]MBE9060696.1 hypothetical protein [cf. Phormidesmis sp. LEGE 11477]